MCMLSCSCSAVQHCLIGCGVPVRPPGGGSPPGGRAGKATAPPPPLLHSSLPFSRLLAKNERTQSIPPPPPLLLSPPSLFCPSPPRREIPASASPEDYPIHSAVCRRGECCAGLSSLLPSRAAPQPPCSFRLLELRFRCFGFVSHRGKRGSTVLDGVNFHSGHVMSRCFWRFWRRWKKLSFSGGSWSWKRLSILCPRQAPSSIRKSVLGGPVLRRIGFHFAGGWPRPSFLAAWLELDPATLSWIWWVCCVRVRLWHAWWCDSSCCVIHCLPGCQIWNLVLAFSGKFWDFSGSPGESGRDSCLALLHLWNLLFAFYSSQFFPPSAVAVSTRIEVASVWRLKSILTPVSVLQIAIAATLRGSADAFEILLCL